MEAWLYKGRPCFNAKAALLQYIAELIFVDV